jgi:hypothetical protein
VIAEEFRDLPAFMPYMRPASQMWWRAFSLVQIPLDCMDPTLPEPHVFWPPLPEEIENEETIPPLQLTQNLLPLILLDTNAAPPVDTFQVFFSDHVQY